MVLQNIKNHDKDRGFTIVELLVVIAVIAILAAITIVSYIGVTTRAKQSQALATASNVQSFAEAYNADNGYYPYSASAFTSTGTTSAKLSGISSVTTTPTASTASGVLLVTGYAPASATTCTNNLVGLQITYWDAVAGTTKTLTAGTSTAYTCTLAA